MIGMKRLRVLAGPTILWRREELGEVIEALPLLLDRIEALEKVMKRVLDCINETRGSNASDAVHDARVLMSMVEPTDTNRHHDGCAIHLQHAPVCDCGLLHEKEHK